VRRALPLATTGAEQVLWGLVAGWSLSTAAAYAVARAAGRLSGDHMLTLACVMMALSASLLVADLKRLNVARARAALTAENAFLVLALAVFAPVHLRLFRTHMLPEGAGGAIYSGGSAWYDMNLHAAIATSFLYGQNFPPAYVIFPPAPLLYPFLPDFQTAVLMSLGMEMQAALVSTGVVLALALTGIFYTFALRVGRGMAASAAGAGAAGRDVPRASALAVLLFLLNGGFGFIHFLLDWRESGRGLAEFWAGPRNQLRLHA
jgi:hypothetical protein